MSIKQKLFVKKYIEHKGNGTKAALDAYDVKNYNTAHSIAIGNLQKPTIQRAIELALEHAGLSDDYISEMLRDATVAGIGVKAKNSDSLRGIDMILKLKGAYPTVTQRSSHLRIEMKELVSKKSYSELEQELTELNRRSTQLMNDLSK